MGEDETIKGGLHAALSTVTTALKHVASSSASSESASSWIIAVFANALSYSVVVIPVLILVHFGHRWLVRLKIKSPQLSDFLVWLIGEQQQSAVATAASSRAVGGKSHHGESAMDVTNCSDWRVLSRLIICVTGLQLSFLSWGILQERMVTLSYGPQARKFKDSLFLVFGNRSLAFLIAIVALWFRKRYVLPAQSQSPISNVQQKIPFYCYLYASLSNITATWFQYEALKFVSFPLQVLSKTMKIIAVMLMGCVQGKTYSLHQYLLAGMVTMGVTLFLFGNESVHKSGAGKFGGGSHQSSSTPTDQSMVSVGTHFAISVSGIILLICYLVFDSFTSNWEEHLFRRYPNVSSYDMMAGINCWGTLLTTTALFLQDGFSDAWEFMNESKEFAVHCVFLAISSAVGSLFIYYTISTFGAVVFVTIMTVRQALAIFLSCIIYGHDITAIGLIGLVVVFVSLGIQIAMRRQQKPKPSSSSGSNNESMINGNVNKHVTIPLLQTSDSPADFTTANTKPTAV